MPAPTTNASVAPNLLGSSFDAACARLDSMRFASALWDRRLDVWTSDPAVRRLIENRLGWLRAIEFVTPELARLRSFADATRQAGFTDVVLLGMGGSSLAPEVMRQVLAPDGGPLRFRVLDSVDPESVRGAMDRARDTLFVLASKSGSTIEPNVMAAEARRRVIAEGHASWGSRFIAITDPDTALHKRAFSEGFRDVFVNPADIGGRYSALSLFGMVPAALMGLDLDRLLAGASAMAQACRIEQSRDNPGLSLGALMGAGASSGRDKLTLRVPSSLQAFGLWVEQLVAESTGKHGKGVVPITGESGAIAPGEDRVVVDLLVGSEPESPLDSSLPRATLRMPDLYGLGAEFMRWEVATAAAGWLLQINPFDEPNVQQAKDATRVLLDSYRQQRQLPFPAPHESRDGVRLTLSEAALAALDGRPARAFLNLAGKGDYVALLAYLPSEDSDWNEAMETLRGDIGSRANVATTVGFGPRYLHSTGQLHKGGANNGVFIVITGAATEDLPVPDEPYSFGILETAQALGDFQSLERTGRRALLITLPRRDTTLFRAIAGELLAAT